jgi:hypothetical protein
MQNSKFRPEARFENQFYIISKNKIKVLKKVIRTIDESSMLELRRDYLQLFLIHYSSFVSVLYCYIYMGNIEFKIDSKNDSKLHSKKRLQTPLHVLQQAIFHDHSYSNLWFRDLDSWS